MTRTTMFHVKRALTAAFPDVAFSYGTAGRGRARKPLVSWQGGPTEDAVRAAAPRLNPLPGCYYERKIVFARFMMPSEAAMWLATEDARREAERPAREAAEKARKAAAKAAGLAKAAETRRRKADLAAALAREFPGIVFTASPNGRGQLITWTGGPAEGGVLALYDAAFGRWCGYVMNRLPSGDEIAARQAAAARQREAEMQAEAAKAAKQRRQRDKLAALTVIHTVRIARKAQTALPLILPFVVPDWYFATRTYITGN